MSLVYWAVAFEFPLGLARVHPVPVDTALEEPRAPVAGVDTVVFARAAVAAHFAGNVQEPIPFERYRELLEPRHRHRF